VCDLDGDVHVCFVGLRVGQMRSPYRCYHLMRGNARTLWPSSISAKETSSVLFYGCAGHSSLS
jgi:hypothetical protein